MTQTRLAGVIGVFTAVATASCGASPEPSPEPEVSAPAVTTTPTTGVPVGTETAVLDAGLPVRLRVGSIGVDATIEHLGQAADGAQGVPDSLVTVGWWREGPRPGEAGNAVFVGHTASRTEGVFDDLDELRAGDEIVVQADEAVTYVVTRTYQVSNAGFAEVAPKIYRTVGSPGVVLMTCSSWNGAAYETTTVVHGRLQ